MSEKEEELDNTEEPEEGAEVEKPEEPEVREPDEYEARAKRMGWVPEDSFRGDKSRWVDAKTFVERGENELPILRERNRKLDEQVRELGELKETVKEFRGYMTTVEQRAYDRAKKELETQRTAAKEALDIDGYDRATRELQELESAKPKPPEKKEDKRDPLADPVFTAWVGDNDWMKTDPERAAYAETYGAFLNKTNPNLVGQPFLDKVSEAVKKQFPEKFENPRRNGTGKVEGNGGNPAPRKTGKTYNDLPPEAKRECDRYVKQELLSREEYAKTYFEG